MKKPQHRYVTQSDFIAEPDSWLSFADHGDVIHLLDDMGAIRMTLCIPQDDLRIDAPKKRARRGKR